MACLPPAAELGALSEGSPTASTSGPPGGVSDGDGPGATSVVSGQGPSSTASTGHGGASHGTTEPGDAGDTSGAGRGTGAGDAPGVDDTRGLDEAGSIETSAGFGGSGGSGTNNSGGETSNGGGFGSNGGVDSGSDGGVGFGSDGGGEVFCADPNAGIAWAGDWGKRTSHGCWYSLGLPEPFVVDKTDTGHDCFNATADVWIPGITDVDGNQGLIRTRVFIEDAGGPIEMLIGGLVFDGRHGNNYRFHAGNPLIIWPYAPLGTYHMRFQFSYGDDNVGCWYTIGQGAGPDGGAPRTLELVL